MNREKFCDIYVARISAGAANYEPLYPESRENEVSGIKNERVRREKYFVWKLFEHALKNSLGIEIKDLKIEKNKNGKWVADGVNFSLSHGGEALAVVISSSSVGIDIEPLSAVKNSNAAKRMLTEREFSEFKGLPETQGKEYIIKKWTAKEAIFKASCEPIFHPQLIETSEHDVSCWECVIEGERYVFSLFNEEICEPDVFSDFCVCRCPI